MSDSIQRIWANEHADQVMAAVEADDYVGFCVGCGAETSGVEPDARNFHCDVCDRPLVFGAEELLFYIMM
jgi:hypothetical protein